MGRSARSLMLETGIEQAYRALILESPLGPQVLLPQRVAGGSRIGRGFEMTVDVVSSERAIELKKLMAKPARYGSGSGTTPIIPITASFSRRDGLAPTGA